MVGLLEGLLEYAQATGRALQLTDVDVTAAAAAGVEASSAPIGARGSDVRLPATPVTVRADSTLLTQLFQNLISNAVLYCPTDRRPEVDVRATAADGWCEIHVSDNGGGIPPEDRARLVRPFERGDATASDSGTGLGLAIAALVAQRHGGSFTIDENEAGGADMVIRLPASS